MHSIGSSGPFFALTRPDPHLLNTLIMR